jgi:hypothetical protein
MLNDALSNEEGIEPKIISREIYQDSPVAMERVVLQVDDPELGLGKQVIYVLLAENMGWNLVFVTSDDLFDSYLPLFESVVDSFSIQN